MTETRVNVFASRGTEPHFGRPSSTGGEATAPTPQPDSEPRGLSEWLAAPDAQRLQNRWVLLSDDYEVLDDAETPSEIYERHPEVHTPFIVYVDPTNVNFAF